MKYHEYLQSDRWKELRQEAMEKAGFRCQLCNAGHPLNVHHRKYPETFGTEPVTDLIVLCLSCHKHFHSRRPKRQRDWKPVTRYVLYKDGTIDCLVMTKPEFTVLKNTNHRVVAVMGPARYKRYLTKKGDAPCNRILHTTTNLKTPDPGLTTTHRMK